MLGILIGAAAVVAILALGEGAKKSMQEQLSTLGSNLLMLRPGNRMMGGVSQQGGGEKIFIEDGQFLKNKIQSIKDISPNVEAPRPAWVSK